ncbi:MAG: radical SAM protein [Candidatus ainarchaeum sp.]|nr:radical SAM protein [Candidatus ainarchaeum sp.]MDD3975724.1 radical SAM protein [Candidatus ainarchaeum sp.]
MNLSSVDVKLMISNKCNLKCKYCYVSSVQLFEMSNFKLLEILNFIKNDVEFKNKHINFDLCGGEPLLFFEKLLFIIFKIKSIFKNYTISLTTNGLLLDEYKINLLKKLNVFIAISLDGSKFMNDEMRVDFNNNSVFSKVINSINLCNKLKKDYVISCTLSDHNLNYPKKLVAFFKRLKIKKLYFNYIIPLNNLYNIDFLDMYTSNLVKVYNLLIENNIFEYTLYNFKKNFISKNCFYCTACGNRFVFNFKGEIYSCHVGVDNSFFKIGDIYSGFNENLELFKNRSVNNFESCKNCDLNYICRGGCLYASFVQNGNLNPSSYYCLFFKKLFEYFKCDLDG